MKKILAMVMAMGLVGSVYAESLDISNLGFGAGISQRFKTENAKACLESHYLFDCRHILVGPFVFVDSEDLKRMESLGYGIMIGVPTVSRNNDSISAGILSFNLGVGILQGKGTLVFSTTF